MPRIQRDSRTPQERLELFGRRAEELNEEPLVQNASKASLTIQFNRTDGLSVTKAPVDEAQQRSFLLLWRRFVSEKEPTFLHGIFGLCQQYLNDLEVKGYVTDAQQQWKQVQKDAGLNLVVNGQEMTPEHVADLLVNGYYFHDDQHKVDELDQLTPMDRTLVDSQFMFFLFESTNIVLWLGNTVRLALRDGKFTL